MSVDNENLIGKFITNPSGSIIEVVGISEKKYKSGILVYLVKCNVCSLDKELYGDGLFETTRTRLGMGRVPCGCNPNLSLNKNQEFIVYKRKLLNIRPDLEPIRIVSNKSSRYIEYRCSVCSKDKELFGDNIRLQLCAIGKKRGLCGCDDNYIHTDKQQIIRLKRACVNMKIELLSSKYFTGANTKIKMFCHKHNHYWDSQINTIIHGSGCKKCGRERTGKINSIPPYDNILDFKRYGSFNKDAVFHFEITEKGSFEYYYTCPVCIKDEYTLNDVCNGVFKTSRKAAMCGSMSCRCTKSPRFTHEQVQYKVKTLLEEDGHIFINLKGSVVEWECKNGHSIKSPTSSIKSGRRCRECSLKSNKTSNGFFPDRVLEKDYLYFIVFDNQYIKVGRTFCIESRLGSLSTKSKIKKGKLDIINIFTGTHGDVFETEQWLHQELTDRGFYHKSSKWTKETFDLDCLDALNFLISRSGLSQN